MEKSILEKRIETLIYCGTCIDENGNINRDYLLRCLGYDSIESDKKIIEAVNKFLREDRINYILK